MTTTPPEYLQASFDPNRALVSQLRGILLAHDVPYSSAAKKADLVALYESRIRPQAASLLRELSQVKASTHGILDGESQDGGSLVELETGSESAAEEDAAQRAKGKPKLKTKTRKSTKHANKKSRPSKDSDEDMAAVSAPGPSTSKKAKTEQKSTAQRSVVTPSKRKSNMDVSSTQQTPLSSTHEIHQAALRYGSGGESGFSDYNPFQSGAEDTPERQVKRRKSSMGPRRSTLGPGTSSAVAKGRKSMPALPISRRQNEFSDDNREEDVKDVQAMDVDHEDDLPVRASPTAPGATTPSSNVGTPGVKYMVPVTRVSRPAPGTTEVKPVKSSPNVSPQHVLQEDEPQQGREVAMSSAIGTPLGLDSKSPRPTKRILRPSVKSSRMSNINLAQPSSTHPRNLMVYLFAAILLSSLAWWREEKVAAGFCDTASNGNAPVRTRTISLAVPALDRLSNLWPSFGPMLDTLHIRPSCTPCPAHGRCAAGVFLGCSPDYVTRQSPLRLGGLIPLPPRCVPDTEKLMIVAMQASKAAKLLRMKRGNVICEGSERLRAREGRGDAWTYGLSAEKLLAALQSQNKMSGAPYSDNFLDEVNRLALRDLESHGEVIAYQDGDDFWYAATEAEMPVSCRIRLATVALIKRHQLHLSAILLAIISVFWIRLKYRRLKAERVHVNALVRTVLDELQKQERQYHLDPALTPTASLAQSHLRDLILHEYSPARRQRLWAKVESIVESNSNVRAKQVEVNGEDMRAWEWQGGPMLERDGRTETVSALYPSLTK